MSSGHPQRVAITGASSGVGRAAAEAFADRGASVGLIARSKNELKSLAAELRDRDVEALTASADLGKPGAPKKAVDSVAESLGGLDVLVVNHAAATYGPFEEISERDFRRTVDVNLIGAVETIRAGLPHLKESGGTIVITGSVVADVPMAMFAPYVASKAGLSAFADVLRAELRAAGSGVAVAMVEPGPVDTELWRKAKPSGEEMAPTPLGSVDARRVARKIVRQASHPRASVSVGAFGFVRRIARVFPAARDRVLPIAVHYFKRESSTADAGEGEALWTAHEKRK
jgi:short-subunit dehydrogenase